jgi:hypothetical protein
MSGGGNSPSTTTQVVKNDPPAWLQPYQQYAALEAQRLYQQGPSQYFPDSTVVPFSPQTQAALGATQNRALSGSPLVQGAQNQALSTIRGDYLNNNPYLAQTFKNAAGGVADQVNSQFAAGGRYASGANQGVLGSSLSNLANQIYGGDYANERNRQLATINSAIPLANQDYFDIGQLGNVGAQVEDLSGRTLQDQINRFNYDQNAYWTNLSNLTGILSSGNPGGVQSSTASAQLPSGSRVAGIGGGALSGAALGGQFGGPWGALIGALGGGLLGS